MNKSKGELENGNPGTLDDKYTTENGVTFKRMFLLEVEYRNT